MSRSTTAGTCSAPSSKGPTSRGTTSRSSLLNVDVAENAELAQRFGVNEVPTIVVVEDKRVRGRLETPRGCRDIEQLLAPWLH